MVTILQNKNIVITGCNKGIGLAILKNFAENGANKIWACVRNKDDEFLSLIKNIQDQYNCHIEAIDFELGDEESVKLAAKKILSEKLPIHALINNAGFIDTALFQMTSQSSLHKIFNINFQAQIQFTQLLLRNMVKHKNGSIVNLSSTAAIDCGEGRMGYNSSKAALIAATKTLARELGSQKIRANCIAPGLVETDMMRNSTSEKILESIKASVSLRRVADPSEIANVALFLASDLSSYITGQVLRVDGGM